MKKSVFGLFIAALAFSTNVSAAILLDFEGIPNLTPVGNFYNGGAGPNFGITFSGGAIGLIDGDAPGGTGLFANEPSPDTVVVSVDGNEFGGGLALNYAGGFKNTLSFFYSSALVLTVSVWDGLNGTGTQLASLVLPAQHTANNCTGDPTGFFCNWTLASMAFSGTAQSAVFTTGSAISFALDNITLIPSAATQVPVPGSLLMLGTGLLAGAWVNRKSKPRIA